jgi:hypothetical protein
MLVVVVARVFRRGIFLAIGKQILASKEARYDSAPTDCSARRLHASIYSNPKCGH